MKNLFLPAFLFLGACSSGEGKNVRDPFFDEMDKKYNVSGMSDEEKKYYDDWMGKSIYGLFETDEIWFDFTFKDPAGRKKMKKIYEEIVIHRKKEAQKILDSMPEKTYPAPSEADLEKFDGKYNSLYGIETYILYEVRQVPVSERPEKLKEFRLDKFETNVQGAFYGNLNYYNYKDAVREAVQKLPSGPSASPVKSNGKTLAENKAALKAVCKKTFKTEEFDRTFRKMDEAYGCVRVRLVDAEEVTREEALSEKTCGCVVSDFSKKHSDADTKLLAAYKEKVPRYSIIDTELKKKFQYPSIPSGWQSGTAEHKNVRDIATPANVASVVSLMDGFRRSMEACLEKEMR